MKERFQTLDAMRGCAAIVVVIYHATALLSPACSRGGCHTVPFGYLAVDLFFALSGFVLAHNYDTRLKQGLTTRVFITGRLRRLLPIYLVGLLLGARPYLIDALSGQGGGKHLLVYLAFNAAFLPSVFSWTAPQLPFPLDPPAWSLFFEIWVANLIYAAGHRIIRGKVLAALISAGLIGVIVTQAHFGTMNVGSFWRDFAGGVPRVIFSFFAGVALYRIRYKVRVPALPGWAILAVTIASFWLPLTGGAARLFELIAIVAIYPAAILLGAQALERDPRLGRALGDWSYAVYVLHVPLLHLAIHLAAISRIRPSGVVLGAYMAITLATAGVVTVMDESWRGHRKKIARA